MLEWYVEVLQAEVSFSNSAVAFSGTTIRNHRLALIVCRGTTPSDPTSAGLEHLAFTYADLSELVKTYERLQASGIVPTRRMNHRSLMSMYYAGSERK
jgi:hypothetical protein